ncbi:MAG: exo-alpha-sialidase [Planctomycetes bacterium]|nr:exo-alpha-sialidase [Planctomycetota bacterium]
MLTFRHRAPGRAVAIQRDGTIYAGRSYRIYRSVDDGASWQFVTSMPTKFVRGTASVLRLGQRLLRQEVRAMGVLSDGTLVSANREWVYVGHPGERTMSRANVEEGTQRLFPPMCMTVGPGDRVLWGEYDSRTAHGKPVRLYVSDDRGRTYQVARVFEGGSILHVHNLLYDAAIGKYWLLAGDHNHEPGIGMLSADLKDFDWLVKGQQQFRAVEVFDFGSRLIYGMDTEKEANWIVSLDKKSGKVERLQSIEGSCIYATRFGRYYTISTTVEPSSVNHSKKATMWVSTDGTRWNKVLEAEKDGWDAKYFQYGSLVLPRGESDRDTIVFSGQALRQLDGRLVCADLTDS